MTQTSTAISVANDASSPANTSMNVFPDLHRFTKHATRTLVVRDLPFSCRNEHLLGFLEQQLKYPAELAHVCFDRKQQSLHYGYVLFADDESAKGALQQLQGIRMWGRDLRFQPFDLMSPSQTSISGVIHVFFRAQSTHLPLITEETLRSFLESFGVIEHLVIRQHSFDKDTQRQSGFGFVTFADMTINQLVAGSVRARHFEQVTYDCSWSRRHDPTIHPGSTTTTNTALTTTAMATTAASNSSTFNQTNTTNHASSSGGMEAAPMKLTTVSCVPVRPTVSHTNGPAPSVMVNHHHHHLHHHAMQQQQQQQQVLGMRETPAVSPELLSKTSFSSTSSATTSVGSTSPDASTWIHNYPSVHSNSFSGHHMLKTAAAHPHPHPHASSSAMYNGTIPPPLPLPSQLPLPAYPHVVLASNMYVPTTTTDSASASASAAAVVGRGGPRYPAMHVPSHVMALNTASYLHHSHPHHQQQQPQQQQQPSHPQGNNLVTGPELVMPMIPHPQHQQQQQYQQQYQPQQQQQSHHLLFQAPHMVYMHPYHPYANASSLQPSSTPIPSSSAASASQAYQQGPPSLHHPQTQHQPMYHYQHPLPPPQHPQHHQHHPSVSLATTLSSLPPPTTTTTTRNLALPLQISYMYPPTSY